MHMIKFSFDGHSSSTAHFLDAHFSQKKNQQACGLHKYLQTTPLLEPHFKPTYSAQTADTVPAIYIENSTQHLSIKTVERSATERWALENFIRDKYQKVHQASISSFSDTLFAGYADAEIQVAIGLQQLKTAHAFLEQYLDAPIENILSQLSAMPVSRTQIVEIGNLAAQDMSKAKLMVAFLVFYLSQNNVQWAVCTGTAAVRYVLQNMGLHFHVLEKANPEVLGAAQQQWGSYYQQKPYVLAINVAAAFAVTQPQYHFQN